MADKDSLRSIVDYDTPLAEGNITLAQVGKIKHNFDQAKESGFNKIISSVEKQILSNALESFPTTRSLASHLQMTPSQAYRKLVKHHLTHLLKNK